MKLHWQSACFSLQSDSFNKITKLTEVTQSFLFLLNHKGTTGHKRSSQSVFINTD